MHLFSLGQLIKDRFVVNLHRTGCILKDPANWLLADIHEQGNTYPANFSIIQPSTPLPIINAINEFTADDLENHLDKTYIAYTAKADNDVMCWHQRLGHINVTDLHGLARNHATGIKIEEDTVSNAGCLACIHGKQHKLRFKSGKTCATLES
jgi:GAG-pre-integrase domain